MSEKIFQIKIDGKWLGMINTTQEEVRVVEMIDGHLIVRYSNEKPDPTWNQIWMDMSKKFEKQREKRKMQEMSLQEKDKQSIL